MRLLLLTALLATAAASCSNPADNECIRRYQTLPREEWCFGERTMNGEEHEPFLP